MPKAETFFLVLVKPLLVWGFATSTSRVYCMSRSSDSFDPSRLLPIYPVIPALFTVFLILLLHPEIMLPTHYTIACNANVAL